MKRLLGVLLTTFVLVAACKSGTDSGAPPDDADAGTSGDDDDTTTPTDPAVAYVGRFLVDGDRRTVSWPGSRIIARFDGTSVSARISEQSLYEGPSVFDVKVDDKTTTLTLQDGEQTYQLGQDLPAGTHQVELFRRTEGQVGLSVFEGFDFGGGKLLPPPKRRAHRIEILGDSSVTGYGVECPDANGTFSGATENFAKAWGPKVGDLLDADIIATAYSGKGVIQNFERSDKVLFPEIFLRTTSESATPPWDFTKLQVDVVVIMLGGNDYDLPSNGGPGAPAVADFKKGYADLVATVREKYPKAFIMNALSPLESDDYPPGYQARSNLKKAFTEVTAERKSAGDSAVGYVEIPQASEAEQSGCEGHPNVALHERIASVIAPEIKKSKGW